MATRKNKKDNIWTQPIDSSGNETKIPSLFLGNPERNLVRQINNEIAEVVVGQTVLVYPIDLQHTQFHPLYGEAIEKTFYNPVRVHALVNWEGTETIATEYGTDSTTRLIIGFHKRRLTEDQDLNIKVGDFVAYGDHFYELVKLSEPRLLFGQIDHRFEITGIAVISRQGLFDAN